VRRFGLAGGALLLLALAAPATAQAPSPVAVGVAQREFHITPYRKTVPPGAVKFNIRNFGEDTHNLVVLGPKGFVATGPDVDAGDSATWLVKLRRSGSYSLICTRANHLSLGMRSRFTVAKPKKKR
jgi:plastocyanin